MDKNENIETKVSSSLSNFAETPLVGYEMKYILRKSGHSNTAFAEHFGNRTKTWVMYQYQKPIVPLKTAIALRELVSAEYFDTYLRNYREEREARIRENAGFKAKSEKSNKK